MMITTEALTYYVFVNSFETVQSLNCTLPESAVTSHAVLWHRAREKTSGLEKFLQAYASDRECHIAERMVGLSTSLSTYDCTSVFVRKASVGAAPQKHVPVALHARVQYLSHYPTSAKNIREGHMYEILRHSLFWM